jgi:hypothetical protein
MAGMGTTTRRARPPVPPTRPGKGGHGRLKQGGSKSASPFNRAERREKGFKLIAKGYTNVEIAAELKVHPDTVTRLRKAYADQVQAEAAANPHLLNEVIANTIRTLNELDLIRKEAWAAHDTMHAEGRECSECGHEDVVYRGPKGETKAQMLRILLQANDQKAKLFQLFGVKAEFMAHVNQVAQLQTRLMAFMRDNLCEADRNRLEDFLGTLTGAVASNEALAELDVVEAELVG